MTPEEAKQWLAATRRGDSPDPSRTEEAFALLETDAELAAWWEREMAFDDYLHQTLTTVAPPPGLRDRIVAAMEEVAATPEPTTPEDTTRQSWWRRNTLAYSLAASIAIMLAIAVISFGPKALEADELSLDQYIGFVEHHAKQGQSTPDHASEHLEELKAFLRGQDAPDSETALQQGSMHTLPLQGGSVTTTGGHPVSILHFQSGMPTHLYTIRRQAIANHSDLPEEPDVIKSNDDMTITHWADEDHLHVLVVKQPNQP